MLKIAPHSFLSIATAIAALTFAYMNSVTAHADPGSEPQAGQSIENKSLEADHETQRKVGRAQLLTTGLYNLDGVGYSVSVYIEETLSTRECQGFTPYGSGPITLGPYPFNDTNSRDDRRSFCHFFPIQIQVQRTDATDHWNVNNQPIRRSVDVPNARVGVFRGVYNAIGLTTQLLSYVRRQALDGSMLENGIEFAQIVIKESIPLAKSGATELVLRGEISGGYEWLTSSALLAASKKASNLSGIIDASGTDQAKGLYGQARISVGVRFFRTALLEVFGGLEGMQGDSNAGSSSDGMSTLVKNSHYSDFVGIGATVSATSWLSFFANLKDVRNTLSSEVSHGSKTESVTQDSYYTSVNIGAEVKW